MRHYLTCFCLRQRLCLHILRQLIITCRRMDIIAVTTLDHLHITPLMKRHRSLLMFADEGNRLIHCQRERVCATRDADERACITYVRAELTLAYYHLFALVLTQRERQRGLEELERLLQRDGEDRLTRTRTVSEKGEKTIWIRKKRSVPASSWLLSA